MVRLEMKNMQYNINREASKASSLSLGKLINMNILHATKYYHLIKVEL